MIEILHLCKSWHGWASLQTALCSYALTTWQANTIITSAVNNVKATSSPFNWVIFFLFMGLSCQFQWGWINKIPSLSLTPPLSIFLFIGFYGRKYIQDYTHLSVWLYTKCMYLWAKLPPLFATQLNKTREKRIYPLKRIVTIKCLLCTPPLMSSQALY